ncbi:MAG: NAD(P)/FAD-dependent oxidoreductase [Tsuneonella sp.]
MAAIVLARAGVAAEIIDRDETVGDALCGGFLSWRSAERLRACGIRPVELGAHPVDQLVLIAGEREARATLPAPGFGLSRRVLDSALRRRALALGARLTVDRIRSVEQGLAVGEASEYRRDTLFLATGKHDVRGQARPREDDDMALGLRIRIPAHERLRALLAKRIELHLFEGGYAGIVLQEDGSANVCLALRKSVLGEAAGAPRVLLDRLAASHPHFAERMAFAPADLAIDSIGAVPYGWVAREAEQGIYRLGDQAAVIPSLAGEGMAITMASGAAAAEAWLAGTTAQAFQPTFAARARRPVRTAELIWKIAEYPLGAQLIARLTGGAPALARLAMDLTRVG